MTRGLYLVTPDEPDSERLLARVLPLLPFATWLQYRNKAATPALRARQATLLRHACARLGIQADDEVRAELAGEGVGPEPSDKDVSLVTRGQQV